LHNNFVVATYFVCDKDCSLITTAM